MRSRKLAVLLSSLFAISFTAGLLAQQAEDSDASGLKEWTTEEDHQNMMQQLGIRKLRPGPSGNESDPNAANYDESLAKQAS